MAIIRVRMSRGSWLWSLSGALVLVSWSPVALAVEPAWLVWKAPPECPTAEQIARNVEEWLKRPLEPDEARVNAAVRSIDAGWEVTVLVAQRELAGERSVRTRTCSEAADFVALSVALAIDPGLVGSVPDPAPTGEPTARTEPEAAAVHEGEDAVADPPEKKPEEPPERDVAAPERAATSTEEAPREHDAAFEVGWYAQAGATFDLRSLPSPRFGMGGQVGSRLEWLAVSGGVRWLPPKTEAVPDAVSDVDFSLVAAQARIAYLNVLSDVELAPYVEAELGRIWAKSSKYSSSDGWLALGAGTQATWLATGLLQPYARLGVLFPLQRSTFVLSRGTAVHEVPVVTVLADAGIRIIF